MTDDTMGQEQLVSATRERIWRRVRWLEGRPDGLLHERRTGLHRILVFKEGSEIRLYFAHASVVSGTDGLSGRMSELDLEDPLVPFVPYTQGMMLTLLWRNEPRRVYTIGFGAGRVPTILHAHIPGLMLESTEIDEGILPIAEEFFGYLPDERQQVVIQDGREYLANRPADTKYDFIHVDAFRGFGHAPLSLGTTEFYALCKRHLAEGGVVCANLVDLDPLFRARVNTMSSVFRNVYLFVHDDATVLYGTDATRLGRAELLARAKAIHSRYLFAFPLDRLAGKLKHVDACLPYLQRYPETDAVLTDVSPPPELSAIPRTDPIFYHVGRNEPCPCGSGRKFKKCHGR